MVLTTHVHAALFVPTLLRLPLSIAPRYEIRCQVTGEIKTAPSTPCFRTNLWNSDEHERFLRGLEMFPNGPWKEVAAVVGTKTTRQTMTHAQKYRQKIMRRRTPKPARAIKMQSREQAVNQGVVLNPCVSACYLDATLAASGTMPPASLDDNLRIEATDIGATASATARPVGSWKGYQDLNFPDQELEALLYNIDPALPFAQDTCNDCTI